MMSAMFLRICAALLSLFAFIPKGSAEPYEASRQKEDKLTFAVLADMHMESYTKERFDIFGETLRDLSAAKNKNDALILCGDNTMNGKTSELMQLYGMLRRYNTVPRVLMTCGNHDIGSNRYNYNTPYEKLRDRYIKFNNAFLDSKLPDKITYQSSVINGYHFIVLGTDIDDGINQYISEEQFSWLEKELAAGKESGKPVFIFSHWPLNHVFPYVWRGGHVGEQSLRLQSLIEDSGCRIFFFNGHLHMGLFDDDYHAADRGQITYLNVPGVGVDNNVGNADHQERGMGLQVSVFDDTVNVHVRNYAKHEWTDFDYDFDIKR